MARPSRPAPPREVRFAVVGMGHIAQVAVLPAFANAHNATLTAIVSGDPAKRADLAKRYEVPHAVDYDGLDALLEQGRIDAVYIALPNHLHCHYTVKAARAGVHVLCEKPMAVSEYECEEMIEACDTAGVKLMIAYRLHFDEANLSVVEHCQQGTLGELKLFSSEFSQNVTPDDIRFGPFDRGGGTLFDMGVYCINAARYLFQDEPVEVAAIEIPARDERFSDCDEATSAIMRFGDGRLASFTSSFGAARSSSYRIIGTAGQISMQPAYEYADDLSFELRHGGEVRSETFEKHDQFGPQLIYFANCIIDDRDPEPDGIEGMADVRIVRAIHRAARTGRVVELPEAAVPKSRPSLDQAIFCPAVPKPREIHASAPSE